MKEHFPLTPKMWQEWAKDEASLNARCVLFPDRLTYPNHKINIICLLAHLMRLYHEPLIVGHTIITTDIFSMSASGHHLHVVRGKRKTLDRVA